MLDFEVITVFPELVQGALPFGVTGRALNEGRYRVRCWNPRDVTTGNYRRIDDRPYGGGPGMVMMADPLTLCLQSIHRKRVEEGRTSCASRACHRRNAAHAAEGTRPQHRARTDPLGGRYEESTTLPRRARPEEIAVGDFVVSGGELPAMR
jgi:tRNA (guanine37-N1)-methyltransferase